MAPELMGHGRRMRRRMHAEAEHVRVCYMLPLSCLDQTEGGARAFKPLRIPAGNPVPGDQQHHLGLIVAHCLINITV